MESNYQTTDFFNEYLSWFIFQLANWEENPKFVFFWEKFKEKIGENKIRYSNWIVDAETKGNTAYVNNFFKCEEKADKIPNPGKDLQFYCWAVQVPLPIYLLEGLEVVSCID